MNYDHYISTIELSVQSAYIFELKKRVSRYKHNEQYCNKKAGKRTGYELHVSTKTNNGYVKNTKTIVYTQ